MDERDWDLSGMDAGTGASGGSGGGGSASGMAADYDDYDSGDMDFDPGEAMAGQDEQAGNDGNDDWSDSGSGKAPARAPDPHDFLEAETTARVDFTGGVRGVYFLVGARTGPGRGGPTYRSQAPGRGWEPLDPEEHAADNPDTPTNETQFWISHFLFSRVRFRVVVTVRWVGEGPAPASIQMQHRSYTAIRDPAERVRVGGSAVGPEPRPGPLETRTVSFEHGTATSTFSITRVGVWRADRFSVSFTPGVHVTVFAAPY